MFEPVRDFRIIKQKVYMLCIEVRRCSNEDDSAMSTPTIQGLTIRATAFIKARAGTGVLTDQVDYHAGRSTLKGVRTPATFK